MLATLLGIVIDLRALHPEKVRLPMLVILVGIVIKVRALQPEYLQVFYYQLFTY